MVLIIKRQDGTEYWRENFNKMKDCRDWALVEMGRPYWDSNFWFILQDSGGSIENFDVSTLPETDEEIVWLDLVAGVVSVNQQEKTAILSARADEFDSDSWLRGRLAEYPPMSDVTEALIEASEGRPEKLVEVSAARAVVRNKYPKPE